MEKKQYVIIALIIVLSIFVIIFVGRPSIIGYTTYQQMKSSNYSIEDYGKDIQEMKSRLLVVNTNLSSCYEFNTQLFAEFKGCSNKHSECEKELGILKTEFNLSKQDLKQKNKEIERLNNEMDEINKLNEHYKILAQNMADLK